MENASKALIIAGAILISILIIGLGVFIYQKVSTQVDTSSDLSEYEIQAFNSKFERYLTGNTITYEQARGFLEVARANNNTPGNKFVRVGVYNTTATGAGNAISNDDGDSKFTEMFRLLEQNKGKTFKVVTPGGYTRYKDGLFNAATIRIE